MNIQNTYIGQSSVVTRYGGNKIADQAIWRDRVMKRLYTCAANRTKLMKYLQTISTTPRAASSKAKVSIFPSSPGTSKCFTLSLLKNVMILLKLLFSRALVIGLCTYGKNLTVTKIKANYVRLFQFRIESFYEQE